MPTRYNICLFRQIVQTSHKPDDPLVIEVDRQSI
jgi:hypothetical protein